MAELHSITGLFYEEFPGISPWSGFFVKHFNEEISDIEGRLVDIYGSSELVGEITPDLLNFRKSYHENNAQEFDYKFSLVDGIWRGEYQSTKKQYSGKSICKTNLVLSNLEFNHIDLSTPEGYAQAIIDNMIQSGLINIVNDSQTDEEYIEPC